jgi:predicted transcriptional regulator
MPLPDEVEMWAALEESGMPRTQIAKIAGKSRQTVTKALGAKPHAAPVPREQHNIRMHPTLYKHVADMAKSMGLTISGGNHAGEGSVAELLELIGAGHLTVSLREEDDGRARDNGRARD